MSAHLTEIDLYHALQSLRSLCPSQWQISIVSKEFQQLADESVDNSEILSQMYQLIGDQAHYGHGDFSYKAKSISYHAFPITSQAQEPVGYALLFTTETTNLHPNIPQIKLVIDMISQEVSLTEELNAMARELSDRYEELNLVYSTSDQIDIENANESVLQDIVQNVVDYLDAQFAVIAIPSKEIWIVRTVESLDPSDIEADLWDLSQPILNWLKDNNQPLVVNDPREFKHIEAAQHLPFRLLASPIKNLHNEVIGGFAMCKSLQGSNISNSDKNLVSALADKVAKVIQYSYDDATGLPHQSLFVHSVNKALEQDKRAEHTLVRISVNDATYIADQHGLEIAQNSYRHLASLISAMGRESDITGRLENGDISLFLPNCDGMVAVSKAQKLVSEIQTAPLVFGEVRVHLHVSIGIASSTATNPYDADVLISQSSLAARIALESTENDIQTFLSDDQLIVQHQWAGATLSLLKLAIAEDGFELYAQQIAPLNSTDVDPHYEVLLRLIDRENNIVSPADFIPLAEKHNLMGKIDLWVLNHALQELVQSEILESSPHTIGSINLSGQSITDESFLEEVIEIIHNARVAPHNICFEITETAAIGDLTKAQHFITTLRELGCKFALDDFGAGLSSFTYLRTLPLDYVKIDGFFVKDLLTDPVAETMVKSIHEVGSVMGLETVAEYVEDLEIAKRLESLGIHFGQGYGIGRPIPIREYFAEIRNTLKSAHG